MQKRRKLSKHLQHYVEYPGTYNIITKSMEKQGLLSFEMQSEIAQEIEVENRC
jgi:hypothetical protein